MPTRLTTTCSSWSNTTASRTVTHRVNHAPGSRSGTSRCATTGREGGPTLTVGRNRRRYCGRPMANILELLRGVLTSADEQERFSGNPHGYLTAHDCGDLTGEDVVE